jgi:hypothetical protein
VDKRGVSASASTTTYFEPYNNTFYRAEGVENSLSQVKNELKTMEEVAAAKKEEAKRPK